MRRLSSRKKAATPADESSGTSRGARGRSAVLPKESASKKKNLQKQEQESDEDDNVTTFEVESVVDSRIVHGQTQYKIRWKGYAADGDTWEQESNLNCPDLVKKYLDQAEKERAKKNGVKRELDGGESEDDWKPTEKSPANQKSPGSSSKRSKKSNGSEVEKEDTKTVKGIMKVDGSKPPKKPSKEEKDEDEKEYEVEKVVDVCFEGPTKRLFLIRWKGFDASEDSWEPEKNLYCQEKIEEFMKKYSGNGDGRQTRENPKKVNAFPVDAQGKRHSRRSKGKNRKTYFDLE